MAIYTSNYTKDEIDEGVGLGLASPLNIYKSIVAAICASSIDGFTVTETTNAEWNYVLIDSEDRIIAGVRTDGSLYIADIDSRGTLGSYTIAQIDAAIGSISGKQDVIDAQHKLSADLVDDSTTTNKFTNATEKQAWNNKQDALFSGTNIKTINNESILGSGNINIQGGGGSQVQSDWNQTDNTAVDYIKNKPTIPVNTDTIPTAYCTTDGATAAKVATLTGYTRNTTAYVVLTMTENNTAESALTLNINNTGDKTIYINNAVSSASNCTLPAGTYIVYVTSNYYYINTNGKLTVGGVHTTGNGTAYTFWSTDGSSKILASMVYCSTIANTAAKVGSCTHYAKTQSYLMVYIANANSYSGKITLNVNSLGAGDIYINGTVSSSSNKTLPAGLYLVYCDGTDYYFRTDGKFPGLIDASEKEDKIAIETKSSGTSMTATLGKYYRFTYNVGTLAITLPTPASNTYAQSIIFCFNTGTSPNVTFTSSGNTIYKSDGFSIEASTRYEVNALWNGGAWVIMAVKIS